MGKRRLTKPLHAVYFDGDGKGEIDTLPVGATLTATGGGSVPGFIEILHGGRVLHAFEQDLRDRSKKK